MKDLVIVWFIVIIGTIIINQAYDALESNFQEALQSLKDARDLGNQAIQELAPDPLDSYRYLLLGFGSLYTVVRIFPYLPISR